MGLRTPILGCVSWRTEEEVAVRDNSDLLSSEVTKAAVDEVLIALPLCKLSYSLARLSKRLEKSTPVFQNCSSNALTMTLPWKNYQLSYSIQV